MAFDWNWTDLITGVLGVALGWLAKVLHISTSGSK
jgi:hypothetical protein